MTQAPHPAPDADRRARRDCRQRLRSPRHPNAPTAAAATCATVTSGQLTIGTDNPAYPPWYAGGSKSSWKINDPSTGKGYESAVAYAIAAKLGYSKAHVKWTYIPFNKAFAPGPKSFDFDINQISITPPARRSSRSARRTTT